MHQLHLEKSEGNQTSEPFKSTSLNIYLYKVFSTTLFALSSAFPLLSLLSVSSSSKMNEGRVLSLIFSLIKPSFDHQIEDVISLFHNEIFVLNEQELFLFFSLQLLHVSLKHQNLGYRVGLGDWSSLVTTLYRSDDHAVAIFHSSFIQLFGICLNLILMIKAKFEWNPTVLNSIK